MIKDTLKIKVDDLLEYFNSAIEKDDITIRGAYSNIDPRIYRQVKAINKSSLGDFETSPAKYLRKKTKPSNFKKDAFRFGDAFERMLLYPNTFDDRFVLYPEGDGRKTEVKEARKEFEKSIANGFEKIEEGELKAINQMVEATQENNLARNLLEDAHYQVMILWKDEITGEWCKGLIDSVLISGDAIHLSDIKSNKNFSLANLYENWDAFKYHGQGSYYFDGWYLATNKPANSFSFIFACKPSNFNEFDESDIFTEVVQMTAKDFTEGREWYRGLLTKLSKTIKENSFYFAKQITRPAWIERRRAA